MTRLTTFRREGLVFDVRDGGPLDGETVVLLHGFPQDATAWELVAPLLHEAGLRTLAPDQRGYSPGARPSGRDAYRLREIVADTLALLDAGGVERAHLVGHDWGGAAVWAAVRRHPQRFASAVVVSTPHPAALAYATTHGAQGLRSSYMALLQLPVVPEVVLPAVFEQGLRATGLPADRAAHYARRMREPGALTGALGWYRALGVGIARVLPRVLDPRPHPRPPEARDDGGPSSGSPSQAPGRQQWRGPTTYLWGRHDMALGRTAAERTGRYVRGDYRFVELDAGHWLPETRPVEVASAVLERAGRTR
ncbi:MAG TPA: alpha/beta fold hydrolase [Kineosporiaceae bacterium]|nr:alpha/beta fold hydrolase [Kineosporiaceae bacterium]